MNRATRLLAATLACAGAFAGTSVSANAATLDIVLAGDSYTSGNGAGSYYDTRCNRSRFNWGERYATILRGKGLTVNVKNAACGGAVLKDLDAQINAVTPETDLVALTIGGNDVGFVNIVVQCFTPVVADPARCRSAVSAGKNGVAGVQAGSLQKLALLRTKLRPGAKVIVLSYPYLANPGSYVLRGLFNAFNAGKAVRELGDMGDQAILNAQAQANADAGYELVKYIPTKDLFVGHEPNQDPYVNNPKTWIWEFSGGYYSPLDIYHPNPSGQVAMASAVLRQAGPTGDFGLAQ